MPNEDNQSSNKSGAHHRSQQSPTNVTTADVTVHHQSTASEDEQHRVHSTIASTNHSQSQTNTSWKLPSLVDLDHYESVASRIMERIRDLQKDHHKKSLQHLLASQSAAIAASRQAQIQQKLYPGGGTSLVQTSTANQNVYDTVADVLQESSSSSSGGRAETNGVTSDSTSSSTSAASSQHATPTSANVPSTLGAAAAAAAYHKPDLPDMNSSNLDSQRADIEAWLSGMEARFNEFAQEYSPAKTRERIEALAAAAAASASKDGQPSAVAKSDKDSVLRKQLTIIQNFQMELDQYTKLLCTLSNSVDGRLVSLAPKGADITRSNISMPYYDHLIKLRQNVDQMQIRINDLYLRCVDGLVFNLFVVVKHAFCLFAASNVNCVVCKNFSQLSTIHRVESIWRPC